jgi:hypothetical protein
MIDCTRRPGARNGLPASDQPAHRQGASTSATIPLSPKSARGADEIGRAVGTLLNRRRVANTSITDNALSFMNDYAAIAVEGAFDGFDVLRTSVPAARCCLVRTR